CGFIQSARDEATAAIRDAVRWKKAGRKRGFIRKVVVCGCWAQRDKESILALTKEIDAVVGIDEVPNMADIILSLFDDDEQIVRVSEASPTYLYDHTTPRISATPPSFSLVKIAEGCNHRCSFCAIPGIRGNQRSRAVSSVVTECKQLIASGAKELDIIAQDTTAYGIDLPERPTLAALLKKINAIKGDYWLRVQYTHPFHITDEFLDCFEQCDHLVPYLDVPLQHISDPLLKSMRRAITSDQTRRLMDSIRSRFPEMCIRTTLITGYPGETEEHFQELYDFVREYEFDRLGVFPYSPEPGTPAAAITEGLVPARVAEERMEALMKLQQGISLKRNKALIGKRCRVLVEGQETPRLWVARGTGDAPDVDQEIEITCPKGMKLKMDEFAWVTITGASEYKLSAQAESPAK
ncbi:MAG: 30S ribosomal protein S12 methylthiotransferase RimO, partial [Victivallales bacterium]|nr:30S ribosomal protein S12 methylthiotransferase RimO [Victivallales bacterium]